MKPSGRRTVEALVEAARVESPETLVWLGQPVALQEGPGSPADALARILYAGFYCRGGEASPRIRVPGGGPGLRRRALERLSARIPDPWRWEGGWRVRGRRGDRWIVRKNGLDLHVRSGECRGPGGAEPLPGGEVFVRVPADRWEAAPGFLVVHGRAIPPAGARRARIYLNLDLEGAGGLLGVTAEWNAAGLPFVAKVVADPLGYERCDTAIVYVAREDFDQATGTIAGSGAGWRDRLRGAAPAFTRRIAAGVGVADDPVNGESFGQRRCRQLAEGLLRACREGARRPAARARAVEERLAEDGVSLEAPHLEPGGLEYDPSAWASARTRRARSGGVATT